MSILKIRQSRESAGERGRWSSRRKQDVVLRVLRGEALEPLRQAVRAAFVDEVAA